MKSISRRSFLSMTSTWGLRGVLGAGGIFPAVSAVAQPQPPRTVRIAHLSQRAGASAEMANYAVMGAQLGAEEANTTAQIFGTSVELIIEETMAPAQLIPTAGKLTAQPGLVAMIGALDEAMTAVLSELTQQEGAVLLNATARGGALRGEQCRRSTFHTVADVAMNVDAIGQWLLQNNWKRWHFVVAEDALGQEVYRRARWNHQMRQPMYIVQARDVPPENPWDVFEIVSEMPPPTARGKTVADILDTLGESKAETKCHLQAF